MILCHIATSSSPYDTRLHTISHSLNSASNRSQLFFAPLTPETPRFSQPYLSYLLLTPVQAEICSRHADRGCCTFDARLLILHATVSSLARTATTGSRPDAAWAAPLGDESLQLAGEDLTAHSLHLPRPVSKNKVPSHISCYVISDHDGYRQLTSSSSNRCAWPSTASIDGRVGLRCRQLRHWPM